MPETNRLIVTTQEALSCYTDALLVAALGARRFHDDIVLWHTLAGKLQAHMLADPEASNNGGN